MTDRRRCALRVQVDFATLEVRRHVQHVRLVASRSMSPILHVVAAMLVTLSFLRPRLVTPARQVLSRHRTTKRRHCALAAWQVWRTLISRPLALPVQKEGTNHRTTHCHQLVCTAGRENMQQRPTRHSVTTARWVERSTCCSRSRRTKTGQFKDWRKGKNDNRKGSDHIDARTKSKRIQMLLYNITANQMEQKRKI